MNEPARILRLISRLSLLLLAVVISVPGQSQVVSFEAAKTRLLKAILSNTTWPDESKIDGFVYGLYGSDEALRQVMTEQMAGFTVRGKPISIEVFSDLADAGSSHVLVVANSQNASLSEIDQALQQSQTLIVTDASGDKANTMVNFTYPTKTSLAFEINAGNIIYAGLNLSRDMLMFGGSKLDLADIYAETEAKLVRAKAIASDQQRQLDDQQRLLVQQGNTIQRQRQEVAANRQELGGLESRLVEIQQVLIDSEGQLAENASELDEKERILAQKEAHIESYSVRIASNMQRLEEQQAAINEQESVLVKQLGTIESQRLILLATGAVLVLVLVLIGLIFRAFRGKQRLALQLHGKTLELGVANRQLVQVTQAKSRFLSTMSHEIRTPMNGVVGMAELLEGTHLTRQQNEYVGLITKSADTLLGLLNDILDFSKIEAGRLELEVVSFNLRDVLTDTLQTLASLAEDKGLELTLRIPPAVPEKLMGDPLRLRQVMVNLVGNAIKFTETGEVAVELQQEPGEPGTSRLRIEVRDTGIGISLDQQQAIFDAFGQADSSTTRRFGGTGLGLAITRQIVGLMQGRLAVRSEPGVGSTFYFSACFPLSDEFEPNALPPPQLRGLDVLVVDDSRTNRMILKELLEHWGMIPCLAANADAALAELDREDRSFAIAIIDVNMPRTDGYELAGAVRQRPSNQSLRLVMLTSAGRASSESSRLGLQISRVLLKPTRQADLLRAITDAVGLTSEGRSSGSMKSPSDVAPRKVLLVEDNAVNQKVALELLSRRGHHTELACNGAEALEAIATGNFDLVLMDVHMPVMDGLTATRMLREREHGSGMHLPVIALTAGATVEDRENSLAAGMTGFVAKPFRAEELFRAVEGVSAGVLGQISEGGGVSAVAAGEDHVCLDWQGALRNLEGDEAFLRELAEMFMHQYPALLATVEEAVSRAGAEGLGDAAHALKGSIQVIGGTAAAATALQLERLGRSGDVNEVRTVLLCLQEDLNKLREALLSELAR